MDSTAPGRKDCRLTELPQRLSVNEVGDSTPDVVLQESFGVGDPGWPSFRVYKQSKWRLEQAAQVCLPSHCSNEHGQSALDIDQSLLHLSVAPLMGERVGHVVCTLSFHDLQRTFCLRLLQESQACAVLCLLSGSTRWRVMVFFASEKNKECEPVPPSRRMAHLTCLTGDKARLWDPVLIRRAQSRIARSYMAFKMLALTAG